MATKYIRPETGSTGAGTESDPYYFDQLGAARTAIGSTGTLIYTDGTYTVTNQYATTDMSGETHIAKNTHQAILYMTTASGYFDGITLKNMKVTTDTTLKGFVFTGGTSLTVDNCIFDMTAALTRFLTDYTGTISLSNSTFWLTTLTSYGIYDIDAGGTIRNCTLHVNSGTPWDTNNYLFLAGSGMTDLYVTNCLFTTGAAAVLTGGQKWAGAGNFKNCCFYDFSGTLTESDLSGTTEEGCVFVDPRYIDLEGKNFSLRPDSPLIGAGTIA